MCWANMHLCIFVYMCCIIIIPNSLSLTRCSRQTCMFVYLFRFIVLFTYVQFRHKWDSSWPPYIIHSHTLNDNRYCQLPLALNYRSIIQSHSHYIAMPNTDGKFHHVRQAHYTMFRPLPGLKPRDNARATQMEWASLSTPAQQKGTTNS